MTRNLRLDEAGAAALIARINKVAGRSPTPLATATEAARLVAGVPAKKRAGRSGIQEIEHTFAKQLTVLDIPPPQREYRFMPNRDFRLDYAWPDKRIAVEVNGMVHRIKERFLRDTEKVAYALIHGWIVLPVSGDDVRSGRGVSWLVTLWEMKR